MKDWQREYGYHDLFLSIDLQKVPFTNHKNLLLRLTVSEYSKFHVKSVPVWTRQKDRCITSCQDNVYEKSVKCKTPNKELQELPLVDSMRTAHTQRSFKMLHLLHHQLDSLSSVQPFLCSTGDWNFMTVPGSTLALFSCLNQFIIIPYQLKG